jgi:hypothetical protein
MVDKNSDVARTGHNIVNKFRIGVDKNSNVVNGFYSTLNGKKKIPKMGSFIEGYKASFILDTLIVPQYFHYQRKSKLESCPLSVFSLPT